MTISPVDPSLTILSPPKSALDHALYPEAVTIIGATEKPATVGRTVQENLVSAAFNAKLNLKIYPVNPTRKVCLGLPCYASVLEIPTKVDLAVVVTPAKTVPDVIEQCGKKGIPAAIVISAGFKELGDPGLALENRVVEQARKFGVRLIGPNCLGVINPIHGLNATFAGSMPEKGSIAFMSQSGAMCTAVLDWSIREKIGFSHFVSIGSMADVNWGCLVDFLGNDPATESILIYMETIGDAEAFLSAAKLVAMTKPIIVLKAGRTQAAAEAAASHTGSLAGSHDAFLAAMSRVGVLTVESIGELFNCALVLGKQPRPQGPKLMIITNAGGPGVLATDTASMNGAEISPLDPAVLEKLNEYLPKAWSHGNPVDLLGDAKPELYAKVLQDCLLDKGADGYLLVLSPQSVTEPTRTAQYLVDAVRDYHDNCKKLQVTPKTILASWMGGTLVTDGSMILKENGIPCFEHPDAAAKTYAQIWKQSRDLALSREVPGIETPVFVEASVRLQAESVIMKAKAEKRTLLTEAESKQILKIFEIPVAETVICENPREAVIAAKSMGYPVVVKLHSNFITHKSDVGGVKLNINSDQEVLDAFENIRSKIELIDINHFQGCTVQPMLKLEDGFELIMGSVIDSQFGPLVLFGTGGCMVEVYKDTSLSVPPLNATLAQRQIEETKIYKYLKGDGGERFKGTDMDTLKRTLVRFSQMISEMKDFFSEIDINPLLALPKRLVALDARIVLKADDVEPPRLAIRPYPRNYVFNDVEIKNQKKILIRPAHANDIPKFVEFNKKLSRETILQRYLHDSKLEERLKAHMLTHTCCADYARLIPLIAVDPTTFDIIGICRINKFPTDTTCAEVKIAVRDDWQHHGIGKQLVSRGMYVASEESIHNLEALVHATNKPMIKLLKEHKWDVKEPKNEIRKCSFTDAKYSQQSSTTP